MNIKYMKKKYDIDSITKQISNMDQRYKECEKSECALNNNIMGIFKNINDVRNNMINNNKCKSILLQLKRTYDKITEDFEYYNNYDKYNKEYKELIKGYSNAYLSGANWYYGENLPKTNFLSNKMEITKLYGLFILFVLCSNINDKINLNDNDNNLTVYCLD